MKNERVTSDDAAPLVDVDQIVDFVSARLQKRFRSRGAALLAAVNRWLAQHHNGIPDDITQGQTAEQVRQVVSFMKRVDEDRQAVRQPVKDGLDEIDNRYRALVVGFDSGLEKMRAAMKTYGIEHAAAEQRRRSERARKTSIRAEAAAETAAQSGSVDDIFTALGADMRAHQAQQSAAAPLAEMSRVRGDYGGQVGLRTTWQWREVDPALIPREYLTINRSAVEAAKAAGMVNGRCTATIPGIEFYEDVGIAVR